MRELALHILDLLQNCVEAGATLVNLTITEDSTTDRLIIVVSDNGRGMDPATAARAVDPFYTSRSTRHVGLGLPLLAAATERAGGQLRISSQPGQGTTVEAEFGLAHPDRQPLGDMADTLLAFLLAPNSPDLIYTHHVDDRTFVLNTPEIRAEIGDLDWTLPAVRDWLAGFLVEGEEAVR